MKHFIRKCSLFFVLFCMVGWGISYSLDRLQSNSVIRSSSKHAWILAQKNGAYDIALLGSSKILNCVSALAVQEELHKSVINLGTSGSSYAENYFLLEAFLKTNEVQNLIINVDCYGLNSKTSFRNPFPIYEFLPYIKENYFSTFLAEAYPIRSKLWVIFPFLKYVEYHELLNFRHNEEKLRVFDQLLGGEKIEEETFNTEKVKSVQELFVVENDKRYLLKIIDLCYRNKVNPIFITVPDHPGIKKIKKNYEKVNQFIVSFAAEKKIPYVHFLELAAFDDKKEFANYTHTNTRGTEKYSLLLSRHLAKRGWLK